jgi:cell fate regulator YaaT (PSP1 superfamily)
LEKIYPTCAIRYGHMAYIGEFKYAPGMLFGCGSKVVIQTNRGIEIGEQVSLTCTGCDKSVSRQQMLAYVKNSGADAYQLKAGRILREATPQDLLEEKRINTDAESKFTRAKELSATLGLPMKFITCEHLFGGERIVFHFMSETRIDFRELVRDLAHEYHTRIEMHQVGARDEARLVADYEICGRECCCKNFLKRLRPVTMRMAKLQKATLDPSKVSGRCGRLRCCLRYEHEGYEELNKKLPRNGTRVLTARGPGTVKNRQVLTQLLTILYDDSDEMETLGVEELLDDRRPMKDPTDPDRSAGEAAPATGGGRTTEDITRRAAEADQPSEAGQRRGRRRRPLRRRGRSQEEPAAQAESPDASRPLPGDATRAEPSVGEPAVRGPGSGEVADSPGDRSNTGSPPGSDAPPGMPGERRRRRGRRSRGRRRRSGTTEGQAEKSAPPASGQKREPRQDPTPPPQDSPGSGGGSSPDAGTNAD